MRILLIVATCVTADLRGGKYDAEALENLEENMRVQVRIFSFTMGHEWHTMVTEMPWSIATYVQRRTRAPCKFFHAGPTVKNIIKSRELMLRNL